MSTVYLYIKSHLTEGYEPHNRWQLYGGRSWSSFIDFGLALTYEPVSYKSKYNMEEKEFQIDIYKANDKLCHLFHVIIKYDNKDGKLVVASTHVGAQLTRVSKYAKKK